MTVKPQKTLIFWQTRIAFG